MSKKALFGPAGNSQSFLRAGYKSTVQAFRWISEFGLDAFEYPGGNGIRGDVATFLEMGAEAAKYNIKTSVHTPYFISLSGTDEAKRLNSLHYIEQSLVACEALGGDIIVIHTGSAAKISRSEAVALAKDTMYRALEAFPDTKIKFGLETMGKLNQLGTLKEVLDICSIDRRLCPVVDFGHMNARNIGHLFETPDDYMRVFDMISEALGAEYAENLHCHFSKIEYTDKGEKKHLTFADETYGPEFDNLAVVIAGEGLAPRIICESDGTMAEDALTMKKTYLAELNK